MMIKSFFSSLTEGYIIVLICINLFNEYFAISIIMRKQHEIFLMSFFGS